MSEETASAHPPRDPSRIQRQSLLELDIVDLAYGGQGIARVNGFVVFVDHALPGDRVRARVYKRKKAHAEAAIEDLLEPSPDRIDPLCPLFGQCGGCTWQNLTYEKQLEHKQRQAESTIEHLAPAVRPERIEPIIPSPEQWRYRNKMDYTFGADKDGQPILGFHYPKRYFDILETRRCLLQPEPLDDLMQGMVDWARARKLSTYDPRRHAGFLRHFVVRHSETTGKTIALLLTSEGELPDREDMIEHLRGACPGLRGLVWGINTGRADIARMEREAWQWGEPWLMEDLGGLKFRVSPLSFFQVNTQGAVRLYDAVRNHVSEGPGPMRLLDAYCGTGTIGLYCADRVDEMVGIEVVRDAVWDARENARRNGVDNAIFLAGEMRTALPLASSMPGGPFRCVILDPPRGGMDKRSLNGLIELGAPSMVYVSCNPSTLARDLDTIVKAGYRVKSLQAVDLFPQTYHIETVVHLERLTS